jgi:type I restriction enzyme S subunit
LACQKYPLVDENEKLPVLKIKELGGGINQNSDWVTSHVAPKYLIESGDLIFSWSGTIMIKFWNGEKCVLNQHLFKVTSDFYPEWFIYQWTNFHLNHFIAVAKSKATTMGHINRTHLEEALCLVPKNKLLEKLSLLMNPTLESLKNNNKEIDTLTHLRDTLLPKLMSGELKIN